MKKIVLFYVMMAVLVLSIPLYWTMHQNSFGEMLLSLGFVCGVFLLSFSFSSALLSIETKSGLVKGFIKIVSSIFLCIPGLLYFFYMIPYITSNSILTEDDVMAFFQTYTHEAYTYLVSTVKPSSLCWTGCILLLFIISSFLYAIKYRNFISKSCKENLLSLGIIVSTIFIHNPLLEPIEKGIVDLYEYQTALAKHSQYKSESETELNSKGIYVVVIGESQNRKHQSVYGYKRNTTPFLVSEQNNNSLGNWIFFENSYSGHTNTFRTLTRALTDINSYNQKKISEAKTLMEVLNQNGYQTWWISNQKKVTLYEALMSEAQNQLWLNDLQGTDPYDEIILDNLPEESALKSSAVVFIHLMGCHSRYDERYPKTWNRFGDKHVDRYDNSMLYNDYIIQNIYNYFAKMAKFKSMIYLSDHAEDVENKLYHTSSLFTWNMTKIPFFAFFTQDYINKNFEKITLLKSRKRKLFVNDMFFDFLLGILNIKDENYIPQNDFSNPKYVIHYDYPILEGKKHLSEEKNDNFLKYRPKFWLHKVNSPYRLRNAGKEYLGVEMDIIYYEKENSFENSHEKTDLSRHNLEQTLEQYGKLDGFNYCIWFDFKNLTDENKEAAKNALEKIINKYGIPKSYVWVESKDWKSLDTFTKSGWKTSYYMQVPKSLDNISEEKLNQIKSKFEEISYSNKVTAFSFPSEYYSFVTSMKLNPEIFLLTWFRGKTFDELIDNEEFLSIIHDKRIKVVLAEKDWSGH